MGVLRVNRRDRSISVISSRWLSRSPFAIARTSASDALAAANSAMSIPPSWWRTIRSTNRLSASAPLVAPSCVELGVGRHAGHLAERHRMAHPLHRRVALVDLRLAEIAQQLDHAADLDALAEDDASRHGRAGRVGSSRARYRKLMLDRLLVVLAHVLEEPDVDGSGVAAAARVADHPPDHPGEQRRGHDEDGDVERVLPPGQHDRVVRIADVAVAPSSMSSSIARRRRDRRRLRRDRRRYRSCHRRRRGRCSSRQSASAPGFPNGEPPQQRRQRQPVSDVAGTELVEHVGPPEPLDAFRLVAARSAPRRTPPTWRRTGGTSNPKSRCAGSTRSSASAGPVASRTPRRSRGLRPRRGSRPRRRGRPGSPTPRCRW